ncbi:hypothetical protein EDD17DRAFT_1515685 [Pisolithus thermaeus]|nr:hypothetical protein EDD17DRAFT_1515685 [Pisolithus thermaeus]
MIREAQWDCFDSPTPRAKSLDYRQRGLGEHGDAVCVDSETGPHKSPILRREPLGEEQICSVEHSGTGLDAGSCDLSGPKKPLHHEQRGSREHSDDVHVHLATVVTEASSSNFTPETAYGTIQLSSGAPLPTRSDVPTVRTTLGPTQEPLEVLPTGGDTPTIQMTDIAGDSVISPEELHFSNNSINPDDIFDGSTFVVGRPLEAILDMIQEGLDHITAYLTDLATCSGQPPQQIFDCFLKQYAQLNPANNWNRYSKFFSHYTECELECLWKSGSFTGSIESTPSATVHKKCYELFKEEYCDTWQDILLKFEESMQYMETGKTLIALSKAHGIETAFVMAGSIVNQDVSLRYAYTMPGTEDLTYMCVSEAFHTNKKGKAKEHNDMGCNVVDLTSDNDDLVQDNRSDEREDHNLVKRLITTLIESHGQSWASGKLFPWKQLPQKLGQNALPYGIMDPIGYISSLNPTANWISLPPRRLSSLVGGGKTTNRTAEDDGHSSSSLSPIPRMLRSMMHKAAVRERDSSGKGAPKSMYGCRKVEVVVTMTAKKLGKRPPSIITIRDSSEPGETNIGVERMPWMTMLNCFFQTMSKAHLPTNAK